MRWELRQEHEHREGESIEAFAERTEPFFRKALSSKRWKVWVAEAAGRPVGTVCLQMVDLVPRPARPEQRALGYVTNVYVQPPFRESGVGGRMLRAAVRWAQDNGLDTLIVWPTERSVSLYRRVGFDTPAELLEFPLIEG
jgi:GNAT superfamily N-acetyltransferase